MSVDNVTRAVAPTPTLRIPLPEEGLLTLVLQRNIWVNCGMNEYSMLVDMHQWKTGYPVEVLSRNDSEISTLLGG
jgi:hypothetical protein